MLNSLSNECDDEVDYVFCADLVFMKYLSTKRSEIEKVIRSCE